MENIKKIINKLRCLKCKVGSLGVLDSDNIYCLKCKEEYPFLIKNFTDSDPTKPHEPVTNTIDIKIGLLIFFYFFSAKNIYQ